MDTTPLQRAVEILGGQTKMARVLGVKQGHVWYWLNRAKKCPAEQARPIEIATAGKVTAAELRPDLFGGDAPPGPAPEGEAA